MRQMTDQDKNASIRLKRIWDEKKKALGLTQEKAADALGFNTQGAVSQYLNGKVPLNTDTVIKFAKLLRVIPEDIKPELADLLCYVRETNNDSLNLVPEQPISPQEMAMLKLINQLPKSERTQLHEALEDRKRYYDRLLEEIAQARGLKVS